VLGLLDGALLDKVKSNGRFLLKKLQKLKDKYSFIKEARGIGLMTAIELDTPGKQVVEDCLNKGLLINCTQDNILRLLPPFVVGKKDINEAIRILDEVLGQLNK
jgi:acetylornithine/succinyldiaminopimelate/putrescine aminotransferase